MTARIGDNGGPPLDDPAPEPRQRLDNAACGRCEHWTPPSARDESNYRAWLGGYGRRVKEPSGSCPRMQHRPGGPTSFAGTMGRNFCFNFEPKIVAPVEGDRRGFVTIYMNGNVVWQGTAGDEPAEFCQDELDL